MLDLPWFLALAVLACAAVMWIAGAARRRCSRNRATPFVQASDSGATQEPERARALLAGLVPAVQMQARIDSLATGLPRGRVLAALAEQWGVRTPGDLRATLAWLLQQGDRGTYRQVMRIATSLPASQWPAAVRALGEDCDHEQLHAWVANLAQSLPGLGRAGLVREEADLARGIAAWDMARAIQLARLGHEAALMATDETWMAMEMAATQLYDAHASWREAATGYLLGQAMHAGPGPVLDGACEAARACLQDCASPWRRHAFGLRPPRRARAERMFDQPAHPSA